MRKLNGFLSVCVLAIICSTANAQIKIVIDNQTIPTEDIESITILPNSNLISVVTNVAYTVQTASVEPGALVVNFSASDSSITAGQSTTLSWTTQNATSCSPTGTAGGWSQKTIGLPSGSVSLKIINPQTAKFDLTCQGESGDSLVRTVTVVVKEEEIIDPQLSCSTPALSDGGIKNWKTFWLIDFPKPGYDNRELYLPRKSYMALKFNTANIVDDGKLTLLESTATSGIRVGAISTCPGDFEVANECQYTWGLGGGIRWATNGRSGACQLKDNTDYYFNVTFTDGVNASTSSCTASTCRVFVQHVNQ